MINYYQILQDHLEVEPVVKNPKIEFICPRKETNNIFHILDLGVNKVIKNNTTTIQIYEERIIFPPFILLREAYYCFIPSEVRNNEMIKIYIIQIVENELEKTDGYKKWHNIIRDTLVNR